VTTSASSASFASRSWVRRVRTLVAVGLTWTALHLLVGQPLMPRGLNRPVAFAAAPAPVAAALAAAAILAVGAFAAPWITGVRLRSQGLLIAAAALALWAYPGGTMDDWLTLSAPGGVVGPPSGQPYWPLVLECVFLAMVAVVALALGTLSAARVGQEHPTPAATELRRAFGFDLDPRERRDGLLALATTTIVIGILMLALTGPAAGRTLVGQVYFAITVASALGVFAATRLVGVRHPIWFWPAPILAGLIGLVVAALKPGLTIPAEYNQLNSIPAWGLARGLPTQIVGVGITITLWTLRATSGGSHSERA